MNLEELRGRLALRRDELKRLNVAVLAGGGSAEREISLISGRAVAQALVNAGFRAELLELHSDDLTVSRHLSGSDAAARLLTADASAADGMSLRKLPAVPVMQYLPEVQLIFTTLHGTRGEDGVWQGVFELLDVPYVSAGVKGSTLAMDKLVSKRLFAQLGIPTPRYWVERRDATCRDDVDAAIPLLVAKPVAQGSSVGVGIVEHNEAGWARIGELVDEFGTMIIEEHITGQELTAGVIGDGREALPLPLVEIKPRSSEFYNYAAKYTKGETEYICPAGISEAATALVQDYAAAIFREFELWPYARMDCLLDADGVPWFLEANTLPGFTPLSLLPLAAQAAGIGFSELIEILMLLAVEGWEHKQKGHQ